MVDDDAPNTVQIQNVPFFVGNFNEKKKKKHIYRNQQVYRRFLCLIIYKNNRKFSVENIRNYCTIFGNLFRLSLIKLPN